MFLNCGVGEDSWESLGLQGDPTSHPKGDQPWVFIGRTDAEAETPILWPQHEKSWLIGKDSDAGKDWGQEAKGTTEDETVGWHHRLNGQGFGWTPGVDDGQGDLICCSSWGCKELDTTKWLNWTEPMPLEKKKKRDFYKINGQYSNISARKAKKGWGTIKRFDNKMQHVVLDLAWTKK